MEEAVGTWFKQVRSTRMLVSGPMIQAKAKEFAHLMNTGDIHASARGLCCFSECYGISWKVVCSEETTTHADTTKEWSEA